MKTNEIVDQIASRTNLPVNTVRRVVGQLEQLVAEELKLGNTMLLTGFAKFEPVDRAARTARNPQTGESVEVAAKRTVRIKAGATLKGQVADA